jgi:single-strand DNA-binding protein
MLIGNVGKDPELKHTPSGIPVASFRIATSESWRDKDGSICEHTDWHNVVAWRGLAEIVAKIVKKGTRVYIEGKIRTRKFDDKYNNKKFFVEILAENILLLDTKKTYKDQFAENFDLDNLTDDVDFYENGYDELSLDKSLAEKTKDCIENDFENDELLY